MTEEEKKVKDDAKAEKKPAKRASTKKAADAKADAAPKAAAKKPAAKKAAKKEAEGVKKVGKLIDDIRLYDVIERPLITEKTTIAAEQNKVVFEINPVATKKDVKSAIEALFGVNVLKVNTVKTKGKVKKFRGRTGQRNDQRKAIVTLKDGQSIDLAAGVK
jgi:large subunit ribosomal protein L23